MLSATEARTLQSFMTSEFSRVGPGTAKDICKAGGLLPGYKPSKMTREQVEQLMKGINATKIMNPPTDCISPIGAAALEKGLKKEINAEFYATSSRSPAVYRGNPFIIEAGIAYGGMQGAEGPVNLLRFANRVPLLYQQGAGAVSKAVLTTGWRAYGLQQSAGAMPVGPVTIAIHIASVWVPFTSESKEAIAHYPEIIKEIKLALQEVGRQLASYIRKKQKIASEGKKRDYIETYIPHVADALVELLDLQKVEKERITDHLKQILEKQRGKLEKVGFDASKNTEYDEEFAKIGREETEEENDEEE